MKKALLVLIASVSSCVMAHRIDELESAIKASDLDLVTKLVSKRAIKKDDLRSLLDLAENMIILRKSKFECASCVSGASVVGEKWHEAQQSLSGWKKHARLLSGGIGLGSLAFATYIVNTPFSEEKAELLGTVCGVSFFSILLIFLVRQDAIIRHARVLYRQDFDNAVAIRQILMRYMHVEVTA